MAPDCGLCSYPPRFMIEEGAHQCRRAPQDAGNMGGRHAPRSMAASASAVTAARFPRKWRGRSAMDSRKHKLRKIEIDGNNPRSRLEPLLWLGVASYAAGDALRALAGVRPQQPLQRAGRDSAGSPDIGHGCADQDPRMCVRRRCLMRRGCPPDCFRTRSTPNMLACGGLRSGACSLRARSCRPAGRGRAGPQPGRDVAGRGR